MTRFYVAPCPKCGERDPSIRYQQWTVTYPSVGEMKGSHFSITCGRCGYHWAKRLDDPDTETYPTIGSA